MYAHHLARLLLAGPNATVAVPYGSNGCAPVHGCCTLVAFDSDAEHPRMVVLVTGVKRGDLMTFQPLSQQGK